MGGGLAALALVLNFAAPVGAQVVSAQNSLWKVVQSGGAPMTDFNQDQQTGTTEGDLVGNATNPLLYGFFDPGTPGSLTDGTLFFRARVGREATPAGFKSTLLVGIDANADGRLDLFVGVDNSGQDTLRIWDPGTGANDGPSTSSFSATAFAYTETATNYNFSSATSLDVNAGTDVNGDGDPDYFLSFGIPFSDITTRLGTVGGGRTTAISINENTQLRYVVATAQNSSNINQDVSGISGLPTGTPFVFSDPVRPTGFTGKKTARFSPKG
jgi:hypothetical protein